MIGKLLGKVAGQIIALPATVVGEAIEGVESMVDEAGRAIDKAVTKATEPKQ